MMPRRSSGNRCLRTWITGDFDLIGSRGNQTEMIVMHSAGWQCLGGKVRTVGARGRGVRIAPEAPSLVMFLICPVFFF